MRASAHVVRKKMLPCAKAVGHLCQCLHLIFVFGDVFFKQLKESPNKTFLKHRHIIRYGNYKQPIRSGITWYTGQLCYTCTDQLSSYRYMAYSILEFCHLVKEFILVIHIQSLITACLNCILRLNISFDFA